MKCSRYDFARTASSAAASVSYAYKSDASQKSLGSLLRKTWQIRMIGTAGEEAQGVQYAARYVYVCVRVEILCCFW